MTHESPENRFGWILGAFVLGAAAGATVALLTTKRSGRENREMLKDAAIDLGRTVKQAPGAARRAVANAVQAGQAAFDKAREEAS